MHWPELLNWNQARFCKGTRPKKEMHWIGISGELWLSAEPWLRDREQIVNLRKLPQLLRKATRAEQPHGNGGEQWEGSEVEFSNFLLLHITAKYCHPSTILLVSLLPSSKSRHYLLYSKTKSLTATQHTQGLPEYYCSPFRKCVTRLLPGFHERFFSHCLFHLQLIIEKSEAFPSENKLSLSIEKSALLIF